MREHIKPYLSAGCKKKSMDTEQLRLKGERCVYHSGANGVLNHIKS